MISPSKVIISEEIILQITSNDNNYLTNGKMKKKIRILPKYKSKKFQIRHFAKETDKCNNHNHKNIITIDNFLNDYQIFNHPNQSKVIRHKLRLIETYLSPTPTILINNEQSYPPQRRKTCPPPSSRIYKFR